ncbi:cell division protein ZapA [Ferrimonas senticii]|uniref:cell division protein ZapA n=1 Tax=Ferrimonas senticii TaxID=394566 RepID=UPI000413A6E0|nr:cell division protein ZapA [Ferrimonas senticii]
MSQHTTEITVFGRNYTVACPPDQQQQLRAIAAELHNRIDQMKKRTGNASMEQLAVMVALNLLHEKDQQRLAQGEEQLQLQRRLNALQVTIEQRLSERTTNPQKAVESDPEAS